MKQLKGRFIDDYGNVVFDDSGIMELLYAGKSLNNIYVKDEACIAEYNETCEQYGKVSPFKVYNGPIDNLEQRTHEWFIPNEYYYMDIEEFLISKCKNDVERDRVRYELKLFEQREMTIVLKYITWLVDIMRSNGVFWGVGRGSSVASFCLYLIGIHRINPLEHDLNIEEFLK